MHFTPNMVWTKGEGEWKTEKKMSWAAIICDKCLQSCCFYVHCSPPVNWKAQMQPVAPQLTLFTMVFKITVLLATDLSVTWVLAAGGWSSSYKGTEKTKKHLKKLTINICEQWETTKCKILYLGLHVSGSMDIASAFLMENYSVQAAASTVTWCDALMPIQSVLLHQSALWDHLAFQKELLRSVSWKNVLQKSFNICLAEGDRKYISLKNKEDNRKQKLIRGYSHS